MLPLLFYFLIQTAELKDVQSYSASAEKCTYSFTIPQHDITAICRDKRTYSSPSFSRDDTGVDASTAKEMLLAVNRLLSRQSAVEDISEALYLIRQLNDTVTLQAEQYLYLMDRMNTMQKQIQLVLSGTHRPAEKTAETADSKVQSVFPNFTGDTTLHRACPIGHRSRIHQIAPIRKFADETVRIVPRSCFEWRQLGYRAKGAYLIDPDGLEGEPPFTVECVMASSPFTVLHHSAENRTRVQGYESAGEYVKTLKYGAGTTEAQLAALAASSSKCEQYLKWECLGAQLSGVSWWTSRAGERMHYWAGGKIHGSFCSCGLDRSCSRGGGQCNCDANVDYVWLEDSGYLTDKDTLPVKSLNMGDTGNQGEDAYHTIGPLRCYSNAMNPFKTSTAFLPVETYQPFPVYCDYGGWLVIQRNSMTGNTNFDQDWSAYEDGFGDLNGDFWLGLKHIHEITTQKGQFFTLQITLDVSFGAKHYINYNYFRVAGPNDKYRLEIGDFSGTDHDELRGNKGMQFSTKGSDNDVWRGASCANSYNSGWWFRDCGQVSLNGPSKIRWGRVSNIRKVEMKIKPLQEK